MAGAEPYTHQKHSFMSKKPVKRSAKRFPKPAQPPLLHSMVRGFLKLFREDLPVTEFLGSGKCDVEVADVKHHQDALELICGGRTTKAHKLPATALITPSPRDARMAVEIQGKTVGQLKPADAKFLQKQLSKAELGLCALKVSAVIEGGRRKKNGEEEDFRVRLCLPPRPERKVVPEAQSSAATE